MPVSDPPEYCQWCEKPTKLRCVERTTKKKLEVWLCPTCDDRTLGFAKMEDPPA